MAGTSTAAKPVVTVPFKIQPVSQRHRYLKALIYGKHGVGKTYLAATAHEVPEMREVLLINAESGDLTLSTGDKKFEGIDTIEVKDFRTLSVIFNFLRAHCNARDEDDNETLNKIMSKITGEDPAKMGKAKRYHTVIIDSLSEVEQYCMNQLLGVGENTRLDEESQSAEFKEYKQNHTMIQRLVRAFRDLPMHVIFTCADQYDQDELKKFKFTPRLTGKLSSQIQGFMDVVGYLASGTKDQGEEMVRRLYVQPTGRWDAKCRFSKFKGAFFDDPTMTEITKSVGLFTSK